MHEKYTRANWRRPIGYDGGGDALLRHVLELMSPLREYGYRQPPPVPRWRISKKHLAELYSK